MRIARAINAAIGLQQQLLRIGRAPRAASSSLPLPLTDLLGRDGEIQTLRHWLAESDARLITIVGPGGVGKTRLALELARAIRDERRVVFAPRRHS